MFVLFSFCKLIDSSDILPYWRQTCRPISFFSLSAAQLHVFEFVRRSNSTVVELCGAETQLLIDQLIF
jgi:hypothetical protein